MKIAIPPSSSQKYTCCRKTKYRSESVTQTLSNLHVSLLDEFALSTSVVERVHSNVIVYLLLQGLANKKSE
jgi:hypothetical protein